MNLSSTRLLASSATAQKARLTGEPLEYFAPFSKAKLEKIFRLCRRNRRGAALVEFAVVAPIMFLFVFGIIEYGRAVMVQQVLVNASREAARAAVLDGANVNEIRADVTAYLQGAAVNAGGANVRFEPGNPSSAGFGEPVTVTVDVPFSEVSWLPSPLFIGGRTLSATTVMRRESTQ